MVSHLQMNTIIEIYKAAIKTGPDYLRLNLWFEAWEPHFLFTDAPRQGLQKKKTKQKPTQKITKSQVATMVKPTGETSSSPAVTRAAKRKATELSSPNESSVIVTKKTPEIVRAPASYTQANNQAMKQTEEVAIPNVPTSNRFSQFSQILEEDTESEAEDNKSETLFSSSMCRCSSKCDDLMMT